MKTLDPEQLKNIIVAAAREELLPRFARVSRRQKIDGSIVTEADLALQRRIARQLKQHWPDTVFLGEEMTAEEQAGLLESAQPVWCLDPLDGTSNFAAGIPYFAVSLALVQQGEVTLGLVYDPLRDECFAAGKGRGAAVNGQPLVLAETGLGLEETTAIIDFKRLSVPLAERLVSKPPFASQRNFGASALDWCWLAAGRGHLYLHGKQNIWDYAAGNLVFDEAGGYATTLSGGRVFINALQPRSVVAAVDENLFAAWTAWLGVGLEP